MEKRRFGLKVVSMLLGIVSLMSTEYYSTRSQAVESLQGESIYQIMVDRFYDGDSSNNALGEAFRYSEITQDDFRYMHGGDWQGIIDKIDYIKGMGYTAIWISPVSDPQLWGVPDSQGKQWPTAYHGYNVYDPTRASRYFGCENPEESKEILKELVDVCHENEIKVILDVVPNHVGDYVQGIGENAHYISNINLKGGSQVQPASPFNNIAWYHNNGDIDFSLEHPHTESSTQMLETYDLGGLDDIDFDNDQAKTAMFNSIKDWFDYTGADAARVDAAKCMKPEDINELEQYLNVTTFGENFDMDVAFVKEWVGDNGETGMLDFPLYQAIINDFAYGQNFNNTSEISIQAILDQDYMYGDNVNEMVTFIDNHDRNRFLTEAGNDINKLHNALTFIYTVRGVPVVFQGTEQNRGNASGEIINGIADTWNRWSMVTKDSQGDIINDYFDTSTNTYQLIGELNALKNEYEALRNGTQREMWTSINTYAFSRRVDSGENEGQELICAFHNTGGTEITTMSLREESTISSGTTLVNVFDEDDKITVNDESEITITLTGNNSKIYKVSDEDTSKTLVRITVTNAETMYGENIYLAGNVAALGNWNPEKSLGPGVCPDYPTWEFIQYFEPGEEIEFKAIKKQNDGTVVWQGGNNNVYTVPDNGVGEITINWQP